jgi:leucyl/phenylalanyl-tRNA--protein transferase
MPVYLLSETLNFPNPRQASKEGLLAVGGDLSQERLLLAYRQGIFPWFTDNEPILWWSPDPRLVLFPDEFYISRSLHKILKKNAFQVTMDLAFYRVIVECAQIRIENNESTWIVDEMVEAYCRLHESGFAHSVETWYKGRLAGGLYGVSIGKCFFGESMFARVGNASKVAMAKLADHLKRLRFQLIDCQMSTQHLKSLGAREISRDRFLALLDEALQQPSMKGKWTLEQPWIDIIGPS